MENYSSCTRKHKGAVFEFKRLEVAFGIWTVNLNTGFDHKVIIIVIEFREHLRRYSKLREQGRRILPFINLKPVVWFQQSCPYDLIECQGKLNYLLDSLLMFGSQLIRRNRFQPEHFSLSY